MKTYISKEKFACPHHFLALATSISNPIHINFQPQPHQFPTLATYIVNLIHFNFQPYPHQFLTLATSFSYPSHINFLPYPHQFLTLSTSIFSLCHINFQLSQGKFNLFFFKDIGGFDSREKIYRKDSTKNPLFIGCIAKFLKLLHSNNLLHINLGSQAGKLFTLSHIIIYFLKVIYKSAVFLKQFSIHLRVIDFSQYYVIQAIAIL